MTKTYQKYLDSDIWRNKREEMLNLFDKCRACGSIDSLQVHHGSYHKLNGEEKNKNLFVVCKGCHFLIHGIVFDIRTQKNQRRDDLLKITKSFIKQYKRNRIKNRRFIMGKFIIDPNQEKLTYKRFEN